jgi:hypothetical protein
VDQRLIQLLEYVREYSQSVGPLTDWEERDRNEAEWGRARTTDDLLALVGWLKSPVLPPGWVEPGKWFRSGLISNATYLVGRAARGNRDERLLLALVALLADPECADTALELLKDLDESIYAVIDGVPDARPPIVVDLAAAATPELVKALESAAQSAEVWDDTRLLIGAVLDERKRSPSR